MSRANKSSSSSRAARDASPGASKPSASAPQAQLSEEFEHPFFLDGGAPVPETWVDPALAQGRGGAHDDEPEADRRPLITLVLVALMALAAYFGWQSRAFLTYAFSGGTPIELGYAEELRETPTYWDGHLLTLPANRYVTIEGVTERRSTSGDRIFNKLLGSHVYVETRFVDDRPVAMRDQPIERARGTESQADTYSGSGRLVAFQDLPKRYHSLVRYYSTNFRTEFCGFAPTPELVQWQNNHRSRAELTLLDELGRQPTADELAAALGNDLQCHNGYFLHDGVAPRSLWYWPLIYVLLAGIFVGAGVFLWRTWRPTP